MRPPSHPPGSQSRPAAPLAGTLLLLAAMALAPLAYRGLAMAERAVAWSAIDAGGVGSDLLVALGLGLAISAVRRLRTVIAGLSALTCAVVHHANFEHLRALGGSMSLFYADQLTDATFVRGSALQAGMGVESVAIVVASVVMAVAGSLLMGAVPVRAGRRGLAAVAALGVAVFALPMQSVAMSWRQSNVVAENLRWLARSGAPARSARAELDEAGRGRLARALGRDPRGGEPLGPLAHRGTNVLLVLVEGISGAYLERVRTAAALPRVGDLDLPRLDRRTRGGLLYPNFIANQRQTSRGEYAVLCGDYPALVTHPARMTSGEPPPHACLPRIMSELGYASVYLQAAPLAYNRKDAFMPMTGFERSHGVAWFEEAPYRSFWGVDDRVFFDGALELIDELRAQGRPWFLTLLTVGTHHPYFRPRGDTGEFVSTTLGDALDFADQALERFVDGLRSAGILDDTLVLITSDEAAGLKDDSLGFPARVGGNWGTLLVLAPQGWRGVVDEPFMQADLPVSVLDYLGEGARWREGLGRSVFRRYPQPRPLAFGNTYSRLVGLLDERRRMTLCDEGFGSCETHRTAPGSVFVPADGPPEPVDLADVAVLRALAEHSVRPGPARRPGGGTGRRTVALSDSASVELASGNQFVLGGQDWWQHRGELAEVDLVFRLEGDALADARAQLVFGIEAILTGARFQNLADGDRVVMRFDYRARRDLGPLQVMLSANKHGAAPARLVFERAEVRLRSPDSLSAAEREVDGARIHRVEVVRASGAGA